jgi:hypothetical protein
MKALNLIANGNEQTRIKDYLQNNVSDQLAQKINNGVEITKDGKQLINKKDLDGFMSYACDEAKKQASANARFACVDDATVFGWAIHYFEEDSIEGVLYTEDGKPYVPEKPKVEIKPQAPSTAPKKKTSEQMSFFDFTSDEEEQQEIISEIEEPKKQEINPLFARYSAYTEKYPTTLIAMRVGDFYELYGDAAIQVAKETELTLTSRDFGLENRIAMVGFPYHKEEFYRNKIREFSAVAIIDSDDDMHFYLRKEKDGPDMTVDAKTGEVFENRSSNADDLIGILFGILKDEIEVKYNEG